MLKTLEDADSNQVAKQRARSITLYLVRKPRKRGSGGKRYMYCLRRTGINSVYDQCIEYGVRPWPTLARGSYVYLTSAPFRACTRAMEHKYKSTSQSDVGYSSKTV